MTNRKARIIRALSISNYVAVCGVWALLSIVSERWWLTSALTYLPRLPYLLPALVLLAAALRWHRRSVWTNLAAVVVVLGPIAGFQIPFDRLTPSPDESGFRLKIVSCNVKGFEPDFPVTLEEIWRLNPDIIAFQEAYENHPLLKELFADWHTLRTSQYWIGSKYPIRLLGKCESVASERTTAITVEVDGPGGKFLLTNLHLSTARHGLLELASLGALLSGDGPRSVERALEIRNHEAAATRAFVSDSDPALPAIVVGDFNMPTSSSYYQDYWSDLTNAFDVAGCGCGYTGPCAPQRFWPDYVPWIRIDHILATSHWQVRDCEIGRRNGSDHRLITATLVLR